MRQSESSLDELGLMLLHVAALFTANSRGRITASNEPDPERAPRLFLGITELGIIPRYRDDLPGTVVAKLERFFEGMTVQSAPHELPAMVLAAADLLADDAPVTGTHQGVAWHFPEQIPAPEGVIPIGPDNVDLLRRSYAYTADHLGALSPVFAIVENGAAVAVCFSSRNTPVAAEAGVDTEEAFRGRGYAPRVAAAWARAVRDEGRIPLYSASGDNTSSRAVARKLGLIEYGLDVSLT